ncbi:MAG TPA: endonuclease III [Thermoanaerobaculia bacterium]|nr:endonuclease III [Thermoanaerobaculia bacterium]
MSNLRARAAEVNKRLAKKYPDAKCSLDFTNPFELLIATILAAQSTDARVNIVTKSLFRKYPDPAAFARASQVEMETDVKQTGFFRNKAKAVIACSQAIMEKHGGEVPRTMDELVALPGVGRKTANVVLGNAFQTPVGVVVDTHMTRVAGRLGLTQNVDAVKIEEDVTPLLPKSELTAFAHRIIYHGRETCVARKPLCPECVLNDICPSADAIREDPASPPSSTGRIARSATPSSPRPSRTRTSGSPRGRTRST